MPTILGLMGLPVPEEAEGMDLSLLARGEKGAEPDAALLQGMGHTYSGRMDLNGAVSGINGIPMPSTGETGPSFFSIILSILCRQKT